MVVVGKNKVRGQDLTPLRLELIEMYKYKALSLISGGLDSLLATKIIMQQGVHVEGINFFTGFAGDCDYCFKKTQGNNDIFY